MGFSVRVKQTMASSIAMPYLMHVAQEEIACSLRGAAINCGRKDCGAFAVHARPHV